MVFLLLFIADNGKLSNILEIKLLNRKYKVKLPVTRDSNYINEIKNK